MSMIDTLQRIAIAIQMLRLPSIVVGWVSLASLVVTILFMSPHQGDRFIIPGLVSLLWAISAYAFITTFRSVPEKPAKTTRRLARLWQKLKRGWYGFISAVFLCTTVVVIVLTVRLVSVWVREYGG